MSGQDPRSDEALLLAYQGGDVNAFDLLYERHHRNVYRMVLRQCGHAGVAEELSQEIWLKVIAASDHYVVSARFTTWLFRIVQNRVIDHLRSAGIRHEEVLGEEDEALHAEQAAPHVERPDVLALRAENAGELLAAIEALPAPQREAVLLHFEAEMTLEEIAQLTETTRETVKSRLRYAVRKLRECLGSPDLALGA